MALDPEMKARWLAALRSGDYKQGRDMLRYTYSEGVAEYCCLGVLCDINPLAKWDTDIIKYPGEPFGALSSLPAEMAKDLGIDMNPFPMAHLDLDDPDDCGGRITADLSLAEMNDTGMTFDQIADVIEYFM